MSYEFFTQTKTKLNKQLRDVLTPALGRTGGGAYQIVAAGPRGLQRLGLDLPAFAIRFDVIVPSDRSDSRDGKLAK